MKKKERMAPLLHLSLLRATSVASAAFISLSKFDFDYPSYFRLASVCHEEKREDGSAEPSFSISTSPAPEVHTDTYNNTATTATNIITATTTMDTMTNSKH
jgi:hypothetical protein